ncbi:MAG: sporulation initiation factor Spo0A C-terminal domain-containing protein [Christensenellales bacterium]
MSRRGGKDLTESKVYQELYDDVAKEYGVLPDELREEMQETIDASWNNDDENIARVQRRLFPNGKPTVEEFIKVMALVVSLGAAGDFSDPAE